SLTGLLFVICNALLIPVIMVLLLFLGWTAMLFGGFLHECLMRASTRKTLDHCLLAAKRGDDRKFLWDMIRAARGGVLAAFFNKTVPGAREKDILIHSIAELEHGITDAMARLSLLTRVGPMLGLMGTLIPLGPALMGLASGDTHVMAQNLVVVFTTTVLGVLIGALAYAISLVRRAWYARDLCDLEFICQRLAAGEEPS
ncbi:MAG: MotA/TolQ/ExbB proton channel family protein, partial [Lentisphaerota bacterium]